MLTNSLHHNIIFFTNAPTNSTQDYLVYPQAYELSTLTGTQVMLLVASETGHVYTFATRKLQVDIQLINLI